jgi:hypothetical protein
MGNPLFDNLENLFLKYDPVTSKDEVIKEHYMLMSFLSYYPKTFSKISELNKYAGKLPGWVQSCILYWIVPKENRQPRINYIKKNRIKEEKDFEIVQLLGDHLCCSTFHAKQAMEILKNSNYNVEMNFGVKEKSW